MLFIIKLLKPPTRMFILLWKSLYKSIIEYSCGIFSPLIANKTTVKNFNVIYI